MNWKTAIAVDSWPPFIHTRDHGTYLFSVGTYSFSMRYERGCLRAVHAHERNSGIASEVRPSVCMEDCTLIIGGLPLYAWIEHAGHPVWGRTFSNQRRSLVIGDDGRPQ